MLKGGRSGLPKRRFWPPYQKTGGADTPIDKFVGEYREEAIDITRVVYFWFAKISSATKPGAIRPLVPTKNSIATRNQFGITSH
jgi:hypothetical protein